ncbi:MAG: hypothetical protein MJE77_01700 [Proteobacteria bacterium]|nr:hypothetical protein [Pseudomonadota bacterium]
MSRSRTRTFARRADELGCRQARLADVERALNAIDEHELEATWVEQTVRHFDTVWESMSVENRARLVRALVQRVEVDEASGNVTVLLTDLEAANEIARPTSMDNRTPAHNTNESQPIEVTA